MPLQDDLASNGDPLEREYAAFLRDRLPSYGLVWSHFVGNDGSSDLPGVPGLTPALELMRGQVNQLSYSAMESAIIAERCNTKIGSLTAGYALTGSLTADAYLDLSETLFGYYAHLGRIRDLVEKMGAAIGLPRLAEKLDEYYKQRNNILHEARVPMMLTGNAIGIVPPEGAADDEKKWGKNRLWTAKERLDMRDVSPLIKETTDAVLQKLEDAFASAYSHLMDSPLRIVANSLKNYMSPETPSSILPSGSISL